MEFVMLGVGAPAHDRNGAVRRQRVRARQPRPRGPRGARAAGETRLSLTIDALRLTSTHLSSAQLGITLTTLLTGYTMEPAISRLLTPVFSAWGMPSAVAVPVAAVLGILIATVFSMILGELVPKNFALAIPRETAKVVLPFQVAFTRVFRPAVALLGGSANALLRAFGFEPKEGAVGRTFRGGALEPRPALCECGCARAGHRLAPGAQPHLRAPLRRRRHMTPRPSVHAVSATDSADDVIALARTTGHSRFPVQGDSIDDILASCT